ncbi:MAG: acyl carrier protein [Nitrospirales bacterium]|nr:acyl carrier protein [Nitrospirales bacterium]
MKSTSAPLQHQVYQTLGKYLRMDPARLRSEDSLRDDLGLDSLQTIELVYEVESAFDLQIPDEDFGRMQTVQDVVTYLGERTAKLKTLPPPPQGKPNTQPVSNKPRKGNSRVTKRKIS